VWPEEDDDESSNWREFTNVVESLEEEAETGHLTGAEVFLFTDNSTVEAAVHNGTSSSEKLLGLVIRIKVLSQKYSIKIHVFHVAGKRMIAQGTDGISRGSLTAGIMAGKAMTDFIPIHLTALERSPSLLPWLQSWIGADLTSLDPMGWFERGLMVSFECDFCVFTKLHNRLPSKELEQDKLAMACIRRINLDAFWSQAKRTVASNAGKVREGLKLSRRVDSDGSYLPPGPLPTTDHCGYEGAIQMVLSLLDAGNYSDSHKQWDTIRTLRTAYSNQVRAAAGANQATYTLADDEGKSYKRLCSDPCGSLWFSRFMDGCRKRMGQDWRPDWALSPKACWSFAYNLQAMGKGRGYGRGTRQVDHGGSLFLFLLRSVSQRDGRLDGRSRRNDKAVRRSEGA
jgi:hypothetical protein